MAVLQCTDELEDYIGNKYSLVIVAAKRARQLKEGHPALATDESPNPISLALREIQEHKISSLAPPEEEIAPAPRDVITSLASGLDFDLDEDMDLDEGDAVDDLAALLVGAADEEEEERTPRAPVLGAADEDETEGLNADVEDGDDEDEDEDDDTATGTATDSDEE